MRSLLRPGRVRLLAAVHAAALVLGPGVHRLPGFGHPGSTGGASAASDVLAVSAAGASIQGDLSDSDCPVCHFLSQHATPTRTPELAGPAGESGRLDAVAPPAPASRRPILLSNRGPPRALLASVEA